MNYTPTTLTVYHWREITSGVPVQKLLNATLVGDSGPYFHSCECSIERGSLSHVHSSNHLLEILEREHILYYFNVEFFNWTLLQRGHCMCLLDAYSAVSSEICFHSSIFGRECI